MRAPYVLVVAALAALAAPASAVAGTASVDVTGTPTLVYQAAGERNDLRLTFEPGAVTVADSAGVTAGAGCKAVDAVSARCSAASLAPGAPTLEAARVSVGRANDRVQILGSVDAAAVIDGGPSDDVLRAHPSAGAVLRGGRGLDDLFGGTGDDVFDEGGAANGPDTMHGGVGADTVTYAARRKSVRANLNGRRDDGARRERDLIGADIENLVGGRAADSLTGSAADNVLTGGRGSDRISGLVGDDVLSARSPRSTAGGRREADRVFGGHGADALYGSAGPNRMNGGSGPDTLFAGSGRDRLLTRDSDSDTARCGRGRDVALIDEQDSVARRGAQRCERIRRAT